MLTRERHKIHLIGVAGSGMSGIAALLLELGHDVSGSDKGSARRKRIDCSGSVCVFHRQHRAEDANDAELIIFSSAIKIDNPILAERARIDKPTVRRAEALAAIMRGKRGIIIAGMHGKTTTSAMTAHVLREGGLHPSHYVGAEIPILGTNAHWDPRGEYFVAEGDESDGTIALFHPEHTLILNIEEEHLDFYADLAAIEKVFAQLLAQTSGNGFLQRRRSERASDMSILPRDRISYGFSEEADYRGADIELQNFASVFCVYRGGKQLGEAVLNVPGQHNVQNAIGVIALATELGVPFEKIAASLRTFRARAPAFRNQIRKRAFLLVDDYGHHPTEIRATLEDGEVDRSQTRPDHVSAASLFAHQGVAQGIRTRF